MKGLLAILFILILVIGSDVLSNGGNRFLKKNNKTIVNDNIKIIENSNNLKSIESTSNTTIKSNIIKRENSVNPDESNSTKLNNSPDITTSSKGNITNKDNSNSTNVISETNTDNSVLKENTILQWDGETTVTDLKLISISSENPKVQKKWRIINANIFSVEVRWEVFPNVQTGTILAVPGDTCFYTKTISGTNITKIYWIDQNGIVHNKVKTSANSLK